MNRGQALKQMFPDPANVVPEAYLLTPAQAESTKVRHGGKWTLFKSLAKAEESKGPNHLSPLPSDCLARRSALRGMNGPGPRRPASSSITTVRLS